MGRTEFSVGTMVLNALRILETEQHSKGRDTVLLQPGALAPGIRVRLLDAGTDVIAAPAPDDAGM